MGAKGLLGVVDDDAPRVTLKSEEFRNKKLLYDLMPLIHRGVYCCDTEEIARLQNDRQEVPHEVWQPLVDYVVRKAKEIASLVREVTFVLDGSLLPAKEDEADRRRNDRASAFQTALEYVRECEEVGIEPTKALSKFAAACHVSNDIVKYGLIEALAGGPWEFVQAPNEADAQIAKLADSVDVVICNDSDLILYGCQRVIVSKRGDDVLSGSEYKISEALADENHIFSGLSRAQLIAVCLITGCDFSEGIKQIGFKKAPDLVRQHFVALLEAAKLVPNADVPCNFAEQWKRGYVTFTHQRVYDESTGQIQYLRPPTPGLEKFLAETLGHPIVDQNVSRAVSSGYYHSGQLQPYDEVLAASASSEMPEVAASKADIINREMASLSEEFNKLSKRQREKLLSEYHDTHSRYEKQIEQLKVSDPRHPEVVEWAQKEARYKRFENEYLGTIESNNLDSVDENDVIVWAMLAIRKLRKEHSGDFSLYALKARPDDNGIPLYYEDTGYIHKADRTPTVVKCEETDESDSDNEASFDGPSDAPEKRSVSGRRLEQRDLHRYGETGGQDAEGKLTHRYMQYPTKFRGDAAAYLGEMIATKVIFVMHGGGAGIVLNRTYNGRIHDPSGLKEHCFGLSAIVHYKADLLAKRIGICDDQREEVLYQFDKNLPVDFQLVQIASKKPSISYEKKWDGRFNELREYKAKHGHTNVPQQDGKLGTWVNHQRTFFQNGSLSQKRIAKLRGIGFAFKRQLDAWDSSFDELLEFMEENGHTNVSALDGKLGRWVATQRAQYKKKSARMTKERIARLEKIGFEWTRPSSGGVNPNEAAWDSKLNLVVEYKKVHGHTRVPFRHKKLGSWVANQKARKDSMPQHRVDKLNAIGFEWSAEAVGGKKTSVSKSTASSRSAKRRTRANSVEPPKKKKREGLPKGTKIEVYWQDDDKYYPGVVAGRGSSGKYNIHYDDGQKETLDLTSGLEEFRFIYHLKQI